LLALASLLTPGNASAADKFKPFKLKTLDGTPKTLQDFANRTTLVGFFCPRCPYCNKAIPELQNIYEEYKDKGLSAVLINVLPDENRLIAEWSTKNHITIPVLVGASQASLQRDYRLTTTPTHYLLSENGEVILYQNGYTPGDEKTIEGKVEEVLRSARSSAPPEAR
jgi:thiol-disulfide isomerase/thioredoxin